jgi:hypothetical protein
MQEAQEGSLTHSHPATTRTIKMPSTAEKAACVMASRNSDLAAFFAMLGGKHSMQRRRRRRQSSPNFMVPLKSFRFFS